MTNIKANVFMLPTKDKAPLILSRSRAWISKVCDAWHSKDLDDEYSRQHLYIVIEEPIKKGEWAIASNNTNGVITDFEGCKPFKAKSDYAASIYVLKLIAATDKSLTKKGKIDGGEFTPDYHGKLLNCESFLSQPSNSFITQYIDEYKKGNIITEVLVEYENEGGGNDNLDYHYTGIKVNKDNTINITLPSQQTYTREEVIIIIKKANTSLLGGYAVPNSQVDTWITQNL